jgi:hypothetical protein
MRVGAGLSVLAANRLAVAQPSPVLCTRADELSRSIPTTSLPRLPRKEEAINEGSVEQMLNLRDSNSARNHAEFEVKVARKTGRSRSYSMDRY